VDGGKDKEEEKDKEEKEKEDEENEEGLTEQETIKRQLKNSSKVYYNITHTIKEDIKE